MTLYYHAILPLYVETAELENPSDYTESTKYLSWERYLRMYWKNIRRGQNWNITRKN